MREMKFRQPRLNDKKGEFIDWFYWGFIDGGFIAPLRHDVDNYQSIGIKDKNGKEMWKDDIVRFGHKKKNRDVGRIVYETDFCAFGCWQTNLSKPRFHFCYEDFEVIGNIHENPKLLETERKVK